MTKKIQPLINAIKARIWRSYALVLVVVLAFALMVALSSYFMTNIVHNQLVYNVQAALDSLETNIKTDLKEPKATLGNQSESVRNMILHGADKEEVRTYLNEITTYILNNETDQLLGFSGIFGFFDVFGGVLLDGQNRPSPEGYDPTERPWYREAVAAAGEIVFLHPHIGIMLPTIVITYARGLFDNNGNLLGVLAMDVDLGRIREYVIDANVGKLWFGILLDEQYEFIFHREASLEGTGFEDVNSDTAKVVAELKLGHAISEFRMRNYQNIHSITFIRKLENGWYLGIVTPEDAYFTEVKRVRLILIALGAMLATIFSVIMIRIVAQRQKADEEKRKADEKVKEAYDLIKSVDILQNILNSLDAIIYITNPETGEIIFVNDNSKRYYNIKDDCIGEICYEVFHKGLNCRCDFCPCNQLDKEPEKVIEWIENSALTKRTYRNTACYITWPGDTLAHLRYSVDITELFAAREEAVRANRVKSDFLAKMSHEIRSPMNVILGITEMQLEKEGLPPDTVEALDKMHNSGYLLLNIINDILDLSKIESGKMELLPVNYDVASVINDMVQINTMRFYTKPIQFSLKVDENTPVTLYGDGLRIKQILNNILSNAFKYTDSGEIVLSVSAEPSRAGGPVILIFRVTDTGFGMTQDQVDRLFDDYSRFFTAANRQIEGTGLGMGITKRFVDMMKGEISVKSELGKGSEFTIRLPQGYVNPHVLGKEGTEYLQQLYIGKEARHRRMSQIVRDYMPYGKVLVVDDMQPNLYVANMLLDPYGLTIDTARSGPETIEKIKSGRTYDIIFMDHYMPGMDGIEAAKIIRSLGYLQPIVALTANALVGQAEIFLSNGFDGFISKPIDTRQLDITLNKFVRDRYPEETVEAARQLKGKIKEEADTELPDLSYLKALIVDDFLPNSSLSAGMLEEYKMQADSVSSGQEAVERIKSGEPRYDFILMDLLMPDMDGVETTRLIRSLGTEYANTIPVIALSAIVDSEAAEKEKMLLDNGFQAVLYKPLTIETVDEFIKNWVLQRLAKTKDKNMEINIPGVDKEKVKKIYGDKFKIFLSVLRSYLSVVPDSLEKMSQVSAETLPQYVTSVHGVKSVSDSIGAEEAQKMALELELLAKVGDLPGVLAKNGALIQYVKELLANIENWLRKASL